MIIDLKTPCFVFAFTGLLMLPVVAQDRNQSVIPNQTSPDKTIILEGAHLSWIENVRLSTRDPGIVEEILIREGQSVKFNEVIARLDHQLYVAEREAARRELAIAEQESNNDVDLRYAKVSSEVNAKILNRSRQAVRQFSKSVSTTELEKLELELKRAELSGEQAERELNISQLTQELKQAQLMIAETKLEYRELKSPIDGVVVEVLRQPGEWINSGEPVARIVNLNRLRVKCLVDAKSMRQIKLADSAIFKTEIDGEEVSIPAKLVFLNPEIDPIEQDFSIWAEIENQDQLLRPGLVGQLIIGDYP